MHRHHAAVPHTGAADEATRTGPVDGATATRMTTRAAAAPE